MDAKPARGPFCQSCGMPVEEPADFGTAADGSKSQEHCRFCFQKGKFTDPSITMEQMIDRVAGFMAAEMKLPEDRAKDVARTFIPKVKRWQKK